MRFEINADGQTLVKIELEVSRITQLLKSGALHVQVNAVPQSTPMTKAQAEQLLSKVDPKSARFLRQVAVNKGTISWDDMRAIFGIEDVEDWNAYALSYGKGITRAFRHLLQNKAARLVWWIDEDWEKEPWGSDLVAVYIDGPALQALREATGL